MNLQSIQEISSSTSIPETTIRRYIQTFSDALPQGSKLGRAWKYPAEMVEAVKNIHTSYQSGLSAVEIRGKLSDGAINFEATTSPPQLQPSLQDDIRELTAAIKSLTGVLATLSPPHRHEATTTPPHNHTAPEILEPETKEPDLFTTLPPDHHHDTEGADLDLVIPDCHGRQLTVAEIDSILIKVVEKYPGRKNSQKRARILNEAGVPCSTGKRGKEPWTTKRVTDNYRHAKKRQEAK